MNKAFKTNNLKLTYELPLEDINKKLKEDIIYQATHHTTKLRFIGDILLSIFAGCFTGALFYFIFLTFTTKNYDGPFFTTLNIIMMSLGAVLVLSMYIKQYITNKKATKRLIALADIMDYEDFFTEYVNYLDEIDLYFSFCTDLTRHYIIYKFINKLSTSLIAAKLVDEYILEINYRAENGDVKTEEITVDYIVENVNITEPKLRVGYDYKLTLAVPYGKE